MDEGTIIGKFDGGQGMSKIKAKQELIKVLARK
jgi:hypothetical protein